MQIIQLILLLLRNGIHSIQRFSSEENGLFPTVHNVGIFVPICILLFGTNRRHCVTGRKRTCLEDTVNSTNFLTCRRLFAGNGADLDLYGYGTGIRGTGGGVGTPMII